MHLQDLVTPAAPTLRQEFQFGGQLQTTCAIRLSLHTDAVGQTFLHT
jgi:hypothetical protein